MKKTEERDATLSQRETELKALRQQAKELDSLKTKVKNMESEHRLLKRDFDLVFATNKSVQKKMERAEMENHSLRKTIVTLANQIEKIEREKKDSSITNYAAAPASAVIPMQLSNEALSTQITPCSAQT